MKVQAMDAQIASLLAELEEAFPAKRTGSFPSLVGNASGIEPIYTARDFGDKYDWTELKPEWLDRSPNGLGSALNFLSDEAACFYIPAFISADLTISLDYANPMFHLIHGFDDESRGRTIQSRGTQTWEDLGRERWARLNQEQVLAVVHYLEFIVQRDGTLFRDDVVQALGAYWYHRSSTASTHEGRE